MDHLLEDRDIDLMLDFREKHSWPPVTAAYLGRPDPSEPVLHASESDSSDEGEFACYVSLASSGSEPQADTSLQGDDDNRRAGSPLEQEELASIICWDSTKVTCLPGHTCQSGSPAERQEQASNNRSEPGERDSSSLPGDSIQPDSTPERQEQTLNSCSKPRWGEEEAWTNGDGYLEPQVWGSRKYITSSWHAGCQQSGRHTERKEQVSDNYFGPSGLIKVSGWGKEEMSTERCKLGLEQLKQDFMKEKFLEHCENELSRWASLGDRTYQKSLFSDMHFETYRNLIIAFRIPLSQKLHEMWLHSSIQNQLDAMFEKPTLDGEMYELLHEKRDPESITRFVRNVLPLDKKLKGIQTLLIKAAMPLFVICNSLEHPGIEHKGQIPAIEDILLLSRDFMLMCGQVFAAVTGLRQERVLDHLHLHNKPPSPLCCPNIVKSALFGRKYMSKLFRFMKKEKRTASAPAATPRKEEDPEKVHYPVNKKTKCSIDTLVRFVVEMGLEMDDLNLDKIASNPKFWFLTVKETAAYKLFEKRLAEFRQSFASSSGSRKGEDLILNSPPSASKALDPKPHGCDLAPKESLAQPLHNSPGSAIPPLMACFIDPHTPPPLKRSKLSNVLTFPDKSVIPDEFPDVDTRTRDTVERLAKSVLHTAPQHVNAHRQKILSNPNYWFLHLPESQAYKFFKMKYMEAEQILLSPSSQ